MRKVGKVHIVGAGPGDIGLITLKALTYIRKADVIVYDRLLNSRLLLESREDALLIDVGKSATHQAVPQEEINCILAEQARMGRTIVRLKAGDPFLFGKGGEEAEFLLVNSIEFDIVPGVTSAISVPAYAGIPVTHCDYSSALHIIPGHQNKENDIEDLDFEQLAKLKGTLVIMMGVGTIDKTTHHLIQHGMNKNTPVAVIENGTTLKQRVVIGCLSNIAEKVHHERIKPPAIILIGDVAKLHHKLGWFGKGVLAGTRILVTRPRKLSVELVDKLEKLGADVIALPTVTIKELDDYALLDSILADIKQFNWLVFTSMNGVKHFFRRMRQQSLDIRCLAHIRICAVGQSTAQELSKLGLQAELVPSEYTADDLAKELLKLIRKNDKILLARSDIARKPLVDALTAHGIDFVDATVYNATEGTDHKLCAQEAGRIDIITFASPSAVTGLLKSIDHETLKAIKKAKTICIGPITAKAAQECGLNVVGIAREYSIQGMIDTMIELQGGNQETADSVERVAAN